MSRLSCLPGSAFRGSRPCCSASSGSTGSSGGWSPPRRRGFRRPGLKAAEDLVRRIDGLLRLGWPVVRRGCLVRGLTLYRFLREAGFDVTLCFGMGRPEGVDDFTGHCWVELGGKALAEKREPRPIYTETFRIRPA